MICCMFQDDRPTQELIESYIGHTNASEFHGHEPGTVVITDIGTKDGQVLICVSVLAGLSDERREHVKGPVEFPNDAAIVGSMVFRPINV